MEKMKILELWSPWGDMETNISLQFMDKCPNLRSAHICMESELWFADESIKLLFLEDLVVSKFI